MKEIFSPIELRVIKILGTKTMRTDEIAGKYFPSNTDCRAINPGAVISAAILRINKKCTYHKLSWFINGVGLGRGGRTFWRDKQ